MSSAAPFPRERQEVFRPGRTSRAADERGAIGRVIDQMKPDEGWLSLPLVFILCGAVGWSIADSRWILGRDELTTFLVWIALAGALWGYTSARVGMSPWVAQFLGCVVGAFVLIEAVGMSLPDSGGSLVSWFHATSNSVTEAYLDLTWRHQAQTLQYGHFCLVLGVLVWGSTQAAAYNVFGYHRSVNGVLLLAVVLIANMCLTIQDQFVALVVFCAAALVLLLLAHAADERSSWLRHRIWRGRDFQAPHLRGGMAFASGAVAGALILTTIASSAPLASTFRDVGGNFQNAVSFLGAYLPGGGQSRVQPNGDFGPNTQIAFYFQASSTPVFTVRLPSGAPPVHWRMIARDTFQANGWAVGDTHDDNVAAGGLLGDGTLDKVSLTTPGRQQVSIVVHIQDTSITHLVGANEPDTVNVPVVRTLVGGDSGADVAWLSTDATDYTVSALVPNIDPAGTGLTEWRLRQAGVNYPTGLLERYTQGKELVGSDGQALLKLIADWAKAQGNTFANEYDVAKAIQDYLRSDRFTYSTDIRSYVPKCTGLSTVDCFAYIRTGFCEQYATTMTMLLRMQGYPARYVEGYLPGAIAQNTLIQQVTSRQKHAWVEVYFPTYGWIPFDPTGGPGQPTILPPGQAVVASPTPFRSADAPTSRPDRTLRSDGSSGSGAGTTDSGLQGIIVPGILIAVLALALFVLWRRRPTRLDEPETVYRNVVKLASRLGYKPRPTQTVYEYAGMLADVVPIARDSLGVVAMSAVEVTYGRREISGGRLILLAESQRRIRNQLLRLVLRLKLGRGGRSRGSGRTRR